jgi:hypothetical protein
MEAKVRDRDIEFVTHLHDRKERIIFGHDETIQPLQPRVVG